MTYANANNRMMQGRLEAFFKTEDWDGLTACLDGLSHREFRSVGVMIGERIMAEVEDEVFWKAFRVLLAYHSKAFLMTMLKAVPLRKNNRGFTLSHNGYRLVADYLNREGTEIDRVKFAGFMLKVFTDEVDEVELLFASLHINHPRRRMDLLLRGEGMACYYMLFKAMRQQEHDKDLLVRCCLYLMKKGDSLSFNLASVCKVYFDLPQVKGTFSLQLNPYQLGALEVSYASFKKIMGSI